MEHGINAKLLCRESPLDKMTVFYNFDRVVTHNIVRVTALS
jgi:hypothetical protein